MKELLDHKDYVKVDVKGQDMICVTKHTPVIITTNGNIITTLLDGPAAGGSHDHYKALRRRLCIIPYPQKSFNEEHKLVRNYEREFNAYRQIPEHSTMNTLTALAMFHPIG